MAQVQEKQKQFMGKAASVDTKTRRMKVVITTKSVDRDGDIVDPRGMRLDNYRKNPVVLWAHDRSKPPVAKSLDIVPTDTDAVMEMEFAPTAFAEELMQLTAGGFLGAVSISFRAEQKDVEPIIGEGGQMTGYYFKGLELLEVSLVPVPANPQALAKAAKEWTPERRKLVAEILGEEEKAVYTYLSAEEKAFDENRQEVKVKSGAFKKSISERGAAGKIPTTFTLAKNGKLSIEVDFEAVKQNDSTKEITEAKVIAVNICMPFAKSETLDLSREDGSKADQAPGASEMDEAARQQALEQMAVEISGLSARLAQL